MKVGLVHLGLEKGIASLAPLAREHGPGLLVAAADESIWKWLPVPGPRTDADALAYIEGALDHQASGRELPFAVLERATGRVIGSTRYLDIQPASRALEIGYTWYAVPFQRTGVNTECKYLLLRHAFETLGAVRVQLKTDARNLRSQRAIERIGGVREGVLRKSRILHDGFIRDTVCYSIIAEEWEAVKKRLETLLARG